jgi:hypothetical protein
MFKYLFKRNNAPKTDEQVNVLLCRFPQGRADDPDVTNWLMRMSLAWFADERIHTLFMWEKDDTPITMSRNAAIEAAKECGADFLLMVDSDMKPDKELSEGDPSAKPFWQTSFDFALAQRAAGMPCVVAAPYCGPPPIENVYVFRWATDESSCADRIDNFHLAQYAREEAVDLHGIQEAAALATGLILIDMQGFKNLEAPYFYYEYADKRQSRKASTEDVVFTRDMSLIGVTQYCNWDAWAGHWKWKCVGKPKPIGSGWVQDKIVNSLRKQHLGKFNIASQGEQLVDVKPQHIEAMNEITARYAVNLDTIASCQHENWDYDERKCRDCGFSTKVRLENGQPKSLR